MENRNYDIPENANERELSSRKLGKRFLFNPWQIIIIRANIPMLSSSSFFFSMNSFGLDVFRLPRSASRGGREG